MSDPGAVTCVVGADEYLVARAVRRVLDAVRAAAGPVEVVDVPAAEFGDEDLLTLESPDLFGAQRAMIVRDAQDLSDAHRDALLAYATDPLPGLTLVIVQSSGPKARAYPDKLAAAGAALVRCTPVTRPSERLDFLVEEIRAAGGHATSGAVRAILDAVGSDLRELAAAAAQLVADTNGRIDEQAVARFHSGRAETTGFAVADAAVAGRTADSLALLASALETGTAHVLVSSALASGLRDVAKVRAASGSVAAIAGKLGMPPWKVEKAQRVARGWSDDGLARAIAAVADADAGVKGGAVDVDHALQRAVLEVVAAHAAGRR